MVGNKKGWTRKEKKEELLTEQTTNRVKNKKKHDFQACRQHEFEKVLSGSNLLPDETRHNARLK
jgi:hypothetical protein